MDKDSSVRFTKNMAKVYNIFRYLIKLNSLSLSWLGYTNSNNRKVEYTRIGDICPSSPAILVYMM